MAYSHRSTGYYFVLFVMGITVSMAFEICLPFFSRRSLISQLQKLQSLIAAKVPRAVTARSTQTSTCLMVRFS